ncbi:MAG: TonB-dependent receptor, partial [Muribaculaceae bacterium]|nr:TonB-dependent receptor [Muribaculaceae bacterium]
LFGRNTMGGLINIHTLSPFSFQGVRLMAEYGSRNTYTASAGVYGRLSSRLASSLTLYAAGTDGFFRNSYNNSRVGKERQWSARWRAMWRPAEDVTVANTASVSHAAQAGYPYRSLAAGTIAYNDTCFYRRLTVTDGLTANARVGNVSLSGIASFQYIDDNMTLDQDFMPADLFTLTQKRREWAVTLDLVARGKPSEHYRWLVGLFGFTRRADMSAPVRFFDSGIAQLIEQNANSNMPDYPIRWDSRELPLLSDFVIPTTGASAYHQSDLTLGNLSLTAGLRLDWENPRLRYNSASESSYTRFHRLPDGTLEVMNSRHPVVISDAGRLSRDFLQLLPKLSASWTLPQEFGNVFASVTKGYKSGGYNTQMFSDVLQQRIKEKLGLAALYGIDEIVAYKPEKTWNYEVGAHLSLLSSRLKIDAALFWIDVRDQQLTTFPAGTVTGRVMTNAGRSRSRGAELSASYLFPCGFMARAAYGYTDARFLRYDGGTASYAGKRIPYAPANTLFLGAAYSRSLEGAVVDRISADVNLRGIGRIYWDEANSVAQPFYALLDASVRADRGNFSAELWADNITSTQYATFYFVSIGNAFLQQGNGFCCGITLRYSMHF